MIPLLMNITQDYNNSPLLHVDDSGLFGNDIIVNEYYDPSLPKTIFNTWRDKNANKIFTCDFLTQQSNIDKWVYLYRMFENSVNEKNDLFKDISTEIIYADFKKSLENILVSISPETINVGVSNDDCAYIYFEKDNKTVYFDLFFEKDQQTEISATVFENKISKLSFTDYLDNSINILKKEFITNNELSFSPITEL